MIWRGGEPRGSNPTSRKERFRDRRSRSRDGLLAALCLGWLQQVRHAAETSREANHAKLQSRTDPNYARRFG
jgi:hypothetical protein